jgi:hypothetical protein
MISAQKTCSDDLVIDNDGRQKCLQATITDQFVEGDLQLMTAHQKWIRSKLAVQKSSDA